MILTHFIAFDFWPGATDSTIAPPAVVEQGGGGGKKRKPFKSYDQRQRERLEAIQKDQEAKYGVLPKELQEALKPAPSPYKRLDPATVQAYQNAVEREDDEAAMNLIMALL